MKLIERPMGEPRCQFCGAVASIDAPTDQGPWAYMCVDCAPQHSTPNKLAVGFRWVA